MKIRIRPHWQILIALVLAVLAGLATPKGVTFLGIEPLAIYDFLGTFFLRALKMLVVPLIVAAVVTSMTTAGAHAGFARLGIRTLVYFAVSSLLAILTGLALVNLIRPGVVDGRPAKDLIGLSASTSEVVGKVADRTGSDLWGVFLRMVPDNVVNAAANTDMLPLIAFSLLFGFFLTKLPPKRAEVQAAFWQDIYDVMIRITRLVMRIAPIGVFGLVARTVATTGFAALKPLSGFFFCVVIGLAVHMFIILPALVALFARVNPWKHFGAMSEALLMAFTTSSSNATLPKTIECLETKAGVPRHVGSFVAPLGATVNMDGTALYECVAALFIAQCYGLELSLGMQFTVVVLALLTSVGVAGIPSASLVAIALILTAVGLPAEGLGLILAVDRILDMCRTSVNVYSDSCGAVILARTEGALGPGIG